MAGKDQWHTGPIFSVSDMGNSIHHYWELLGFDQSWKYDEAEETRVTQANKGAFELIFSANLGRIGSGRVFVSLNEIEMDRPSRDLMQSLLQRRKFIGDILRFEFAIRTETK